MSNKHSLRRASASTLPAIQEDVGNPAPPLPARAVNRPLPSHFGFGVPALKNSPPPAYEYKQSALHIPESEGPIDEKLVALRNNRQVAKRGGWRRLALMALLLMFFIIGLAVGLGVGLTRKHKASSAGGSSSGSTNGGNQNPATSTSFPEGSYSIQTYLSSISTNCTSNPAAWLCYPYTTYAQSPSNSEATYTWIINPVTGTEGNYTISSTDNVFSILFSNASLILQDAGMDTEHYSFEITTQKPVKPNVALTSSNTAATCWYNQTKFRGLLYTKMARSYPSNGTVSINGSDQAFGPWPYAVRVEQVAASGAGTPTCLDASGNSLGDFSVATEAEFCNCLYLNTGT